ncbi:MAG: glutamine-hydrolyzing GMP synthase, partial [Acidimicrobiales bacterium]
MSGLYRAPAPPFPAEAPGRRGPVLVVDYGAQYAQLIARRVREAHVYSEIVPHGAALAGIIARRQPSAIILSGGPESIYAPGAPRVDPAVFTSGAPVLGICYGLQAMAAALGGEVARTPMGEFGRAEARAEAGSGLLDGLPERFSVWMSHRDSAIRAPEGSRCTARTAGAQIAAFEDPSRRLYAVQWHPEVAHSNHGQQVIENFLLRCAGIAPDWTTGSIIDETVKSVAATVGTHHVVAGLSGGVDSAVAAALVQRAVGGQLS